MEASTAKMEMFLLGKSDNGKVNHCECKLVTLRTAEVYHNVRFGRNVRPSGSTPWFHLRYYLSLRLVSQHSTCLRSSGGFSAKSSLRIDTINNSLMNKQGVRTKSFLFANPN